MVIEYKISFENGTVVIHHRVEPDASSAQPVTQSSSTGGVLLPNQFPGRNVPGSGGGGGDPTGKGGGGGDPTGKGGGGGDPTGKGGSGPDQGQIVVFGPVVIDASGLLAKNGITIKNDAAEKQHGK